MAKKKGAGKKHPSVSQSLPIDRLKLIAHDLLVTVEQNNSVDWSLKENACARTKVALKRILRKHMCTLEALTIY